jgi:hypothetical protein
MATIPIDGRRSPKLCGAPGVVKPRRERDPTRRHPGGAQPQRLAD